MKGQKTPSQKRNVRCPQCGLYFAPAGLSGHIRFYHKMGIGKEEQGPLGRVVDIKQKLVRLELMGSITRASKSGDPVLRKQEFDKALELFLIDYLSERGIFKKK